MKSALKIESFFEAVIYTSLLRDAQNFPMGCRHTLRVNGVPRASAIARRTAMAATPSDVRNCN